MTLEVTDSNRATNRTSVKFTVRYVKLVANIERDRLAPLEGDKLTFTAWVNNTGDAAATNVVVEFLVDGVSLGTQTVESIAGGGVGPAAFSWKAKKGEHVLTAKIGTQSWSSSVTVEARPPPPATDLTLPMIILAVVAVAAVGGVAFAMSRRKRGPAADHSHALPQKRHRQ